MSSNRLVIAATGSGVGKTTVTIALMAAFRNMGFQVQGFKCGPDYIDPTYHTAVTGRQSRNLDSWMLSSETVKEIYLHGSHGADLSIIEGVMGFYDGKNPATNEGSTAEISMLTSSPVVLVVNCQSMARSAAAIVKGFQTFDEGVNIVGVIANRVGSENHYKIVKTAIEQECGIPVVGYFQREAGIEIPERHLGLVPSIERGELTPLFDLLGSMAAKTIDLNLLLQLSKAQPIETASNVLRQQGEPSLNQPVKKVKIAVAKDAAFHFYYPENLELLEAYGAECVYFSPLAGERVPGDADGLYIGGGFPEEFAERLAADEAVKQSVREFITSGKPTLAECGGYMYLTDAIVRTDGSSYPMVGVVPGHVRMQTKFAALGYREVKGSAGNFLLGDGQQARGHEFHYSTYTNEQPVQHAFTTKGMRGEKTEGCVIGNLVAGYTHIHFASAPEIVERWIGKCLEVTVQ